MKAIRFTKNVHHLFDVDYGDSDFKRIDEFYTHFRPEGKNKSEIIFAACVCKDTEANRAIIKQICQEALDLSVIANKVEADFYKHLNKLER